MRTVGYQIVHFASDSKVDVEFALVDNKIKVTKTKFLQGNVLSWIHFRKAQIAAAYELTGQVPPVKPVA
jgi:hypothetical protein